MRGDPRLRYLMELAARKQRRTVSSFLEWAIEQALSSVVLDDAQHDTVARAAGKLWDTDEADRLTKLGIYYPDLLTYDEQGVWKLIRECEALWLVSLEDFDLDQPGEDISMLLRFSTLRAHWEDFKKVAAGEADASILPRLPGAPRPLPIPPAMEKE